LLTDREVKFSERLAKLTSELRALDLDLKSGVTPEAPLLREFRQALDGARMTAWTVNELMDARELKKDPHTVLSFLTAERLRRFAQMVKDLSVDIDADGITWQTRGIQNLADSVKLLQSRLDKLVSQRSKEAGPLPRS
jgi:hypothetical protein